MSTEDSSSGDAKNALRDNIARKGKYSYYYGHANQDDIMKESGSAIRTMGGKPKLLQRTTTPSETSKTRSESISSYSWVNMKKSVRIYVDIEKLSEIPDESIQHEWKERSFRLSVSDGSVIRVLDIPKLSQAISDASIRRKGDTTLMAVLKKANESTWYDLKSKS